MTEYSVYAKLTLGVLLLAASALGGDAGARLLLLGLAGLELLLQLSGGVGLLGLTESVLLSAALADLIGREAADGAGATDGLAGALLAASQGVLPLLVHAAPGAGPRQLLRPLPLVVKGLTFGVDEAVGLAHPLNEELPVAGEDLELAEAACISFDHHLEMKLRRSKSA